MTSATSPYLNLPLRTEAQARRKMKFYSGEAFADAEYRTFCDARDAFMNCMAAARRTILDACVDDGLTDFDNFLSDFIGDYWSHEKD